MRTVGVKMKAKKQKNKKTQKQKQKQKSEKQKKKPCYKTELSLKTKRNTSGPRSAPETAASEAGVPRALGHSAHRRQELRAGVDFRAAFSVFYRAAARGRQLFCAVVLGRARRDA